MLSDVRRILVTFDVDEESPTNDGRDWKDDASERSDKLSEISCPSELVTTTASPTCSFTR